MNQEARLASWAPPDKGFWAWLVVFSSFISTGVCLGTINSFGIIYMQLQSHFQSSGVSEPSFKAALVGSITVGISFAFCPFARPLTKSIGIRRTVVLGGILATAGVATASLFSDQIELLCMFYGAVFGIGVALTHNPSVAILGLYFESKLGLVNEIVYTSGPTWTFLTPPLLIALISALGEERTLQIVACLLFLIIPSALSFETPREAFALLTDSSSSLTQVVLNTGNWSQKKYLTWSLIIPLALFGYYVPYVHLMKLASLQFPERDGKTLLMSIGAASGVGRILYSRVAELLQTNRVFYQQISLFIIGACCYFFGQVSNWYWMVLLSLTLGLFDGCFLSQIEPIANELNRFEGAHPAKFCFFALSAIPLTAGPPIAGLLFDHSQSYKMPFLVAGVPMILSAVLLNIVHLVN